MMTDLQFYVLVAFHALGILVNTGSFIHFNGKMNKRFDAVESKMDY